MSYILKIQMNIHEKPEVYSEVIDILPAGSIVNVIDRKGYWCELDTGGFVMSQFLEAI